MNRFKTPILFLVLTALLLLTACGGGGAEPDVRDAPAKRFSSGGFSITLTEAFTPNPQEDGSYSLQSSTVALFLSRLPFTELAGAAELPLMTYAEYYAERLGSISETEGLILLEYASSGGEFIYFSCFYKGTDAFFILQLVCPTALYPDFRPTFIEWAKGVAVE